MLIVLRKRFLPFPLQYHLGQVANKKVPQTLEIEKEFGKKELLVTFNEEGSWLIDDEELERFTQLLPTVITKEFAKKVMAKHENTVALLSKVCKEAIQVSNKMRLQECLEVFARWYDAVIEYVPFLVITKFLPDAVLNVIESKETVFISKHPDLWNSLISPPKSKSLEFTKSLLKLYIFCLEQKVDFEKCDLIPPVDEMVKRFKEIWAGFGPREWELPGYESTSYLFKELRKNFSALSLYEAKAKLEEIENMEAQTNAIFAHSLEKLKNMSKNYTETSTLLSFLWYLQEMLETESQIYRRSFYFGALPILRVISSFLYERKEISRKEDILFLFPPEILGYLRNDLRKLIEKRKETYWKVITEEKKGVSPQRLEVLIDGDYQR
jgi:hypothetical protein